MEIIQPLATVTHYGVIEDFDLMKDITMMVVPKQYASELREIREEIFPRYCMCIPKKDPRLERLNSAPFL